MSEREQFFFMVELAADPRGTDADKARLLRLAKRTNINHQLSGELIKHELSAVDTQANKESGRHLPLELVDFLKKFSEKGSPLKYTTHPWDDNNNFESFDAFVEQYSTLLNNHPYWRYGGNGKNSKIATCNPKLYSIIKSFLLKKEIDNYTFGEAKVKVGLLTKKVVQTWLEQYPGASFLEMPISAYNEEKICDENAKIFVFGDIVDQFKNAIEFRSNALFHTIRRATQSPDVFVNKEKMETLKGRSFYTDTSLISKAIQQIIQNCKGRSEDSNLEIWADEHESDGNKYTDIHILHINSFSDKSTDDPKLKLESGNLLDIKNLLLGLCDFYVESRFIIDNKPSFASIEYLSYKDSSCTKRTITESRAILCSIKRCFR